MRSRLFIIIAFLVLVPGAAAQVARPTPPVDPLEDILPDRSPGREMLPFEMTRDVERKLKFSNAEKESTGSVRKAADLKMLKVYSAPACASKRLVIDVSDDQCKIAVDLIRASFYSFLSGYYGEYSADFRIVGEDAIAGNGTYLHGLILDLGPVDPVPIDKLSATAKNFIDFPVAATSDDERAQRVSLETGIDYEGKAISSKKKLIAGNVYLLRLVNYTFKKTRFSLYDRDAVYLFKFNGFNSDGMAILLWKRLSDREAPKL